MEIIKTPWKNKFLELVANSKESIKITSPFVKENICSEFLKVKQKKSKVELITSFKIPNIHAGSIDINALERILQTNGSIKNHTKLHAKIYLFDDTEAVVTSSNLTNGGLMYNFEYGVYSKEKTFVEKVRNDFNLILSDEITGVIKLKDIENVKKILSKIPKSNREKLPKYELDSPENNYNSINIPHEIIKESLNGWKLEVFKCLLLIHNKQFELNHLDKFEEQLKNKYPNNNNIQAKVRQQLQYLRDLGLIEFLGNGKYKKLWI